MTNFSEYPEWNPFIRSLEGRTEKDTKLVATLQLKDRKYMVFKPVITVSDEKKKFEWLGTTQHGFMEMNKALKERAEFISNS